MGKILSLKEISKNLPQYSATLVGGVFDLFHVGHLKYLKKCSKLGRPLIVIVQSDKTVTIRKGFNRPIINEKQRAEIVAALEFVDFVLILDKPSHYEKYLEVIKPNYYVFSKETMSYRQARAKIIKEKFPRTKVIFLSKDVRNMSTSRIVQKLFNQRNYSNISNPIVRRLYYIADKSEARIGKISALVTFRNKIVEESDNLEKTDKHAEHIVIGKAKRRRIPLGKSILYILIPPCILCANEILQSGIKKVFYLHPYGSDDGIRLLRKNNVIIKKIETR
jgi:D-beta-D-heptose 7-phosphate kinase/D-beta-D-heptose 1-phosphate adenosyltransferase